MLASKARGVKIPGSEYRTMSSIAVFWECPEMRILSQRPVQQGSSDTDTQVGRLLG